MNIKNKAVMNKNIFCALFRFISLNHFQAKFFYKILREKESYMVKVGKQDTFKKYYQLNNIKMKLNKQKDIKNKISK